MYGKNSYYKLRKLISKGQELRFVYEAGPCGYSMTWHKCLKPEVASASINRAKAHIREIMRKERGRSLTSVIGELTPYFRG